MVFSFAPAWKYTSGILLSLIRSLLNGLNRCGRFATHHLNGESELNNTRLGVLILTQRQVYGVFGGHCIPTWRTILHHLRPLNRPLQACHQTEQAAAHQCFHPPTRLHHLTLKTRQIFMVWEEASKSPTFNIRTWS